MSHTGKASGSRVSNECDRPLVSIQNPHVSLWLHMSTESNFRLKRPENYNFLAVQAGNYSILISVCEK